MAKLQGTISQPSDFLIVNGVRFPMPCPGFEIIHSQAVDSARNANGVVVAQLVGRKLWKLNNLSWKGLTPEDWATMKKALEPFFVNVTFTGDDGQRHTIKMYPGDVTGKPYHVSGVSYDFYQECKFNLIDCGE